MLGRKRPAEEILAAMDQRLEDVMDQRLEKLVSKLKAEEILAAMDQRLEDAMDQRLEKLVSKLKRGFKEELSNVAEAYDRRVRPFALAGYFAQLREISRIRELHLTQLFPGIENVSLPLGAINEDADYYNTLHTLYVVAIARHLQSRRIFEFGTWVGQTTYHLTFSSEQAEVVTLDLPESEGSSKIGEDLGRFYRGTDREPRITQIRSDSKTFDHTPYRGKIDFIFVDGDHSYEGVKSDTEKAFEMLAPGGVIVWDDYDPKVPGVAEFFSHFTGQQPVFWIKSTCLLVHIDGVDPLSYQAPEPFFDRLKRSARRPPQGPKQSRTGIERQDAVSVSGGSVGRARL